MRVLVISHMYPNVVEPHSGIFVHKQLKELAKLCQVKVVSPVPWSPRALWFRSKWRRYGQRSGFDVLDGIEVFYPRMLCLPGSLLFEWYGYVLYWAIRETIEEIEKSFRFDLIHCHVALPDGFGGMLVNRRYRRKLLVTIHGQDVAQTVFRNNRCKAAVERVLAEADGIIAVSRKVAEKVRAHCRDGSKVRTINDGFSLQDVVEADTQLRDRYAAGKILLAVGSLVKSKGHDLLLQALASVVRQIGDVRLLIIGSGREKQDLKRLVARLGLESHVSFLGSLPHQEVMRYMSICDMFVLPSWSEGFGISYLEAMAHGKPVIACRGEGIEDIVVDGENGILVTPRNVEDVERAITTLLVKETYREAMGSKARRMAENYTWGGIAQQIFALYSEVTGAN